ncbi:hypothetical protein PR003_g4381 [Phytophthora rubi]|uniref:Uncharacterized protein n=1 Tax=Phytophthora rubi TaxID=129364 RepID=A0A6A4FWY6_9STRA|nr:hypothetical protein PR003_g4381 [Phytophthora rubi]
MFVPTDQALSTYRAPPTSLSSPSSFVEAADARPISALFEFQLSLDVDSDAPDSDVSSQRTETSPSSPVSPTTTIARSDVVGCIVLASPAVSTVTPRTPQRDNRRVYHPRFQRLDILEWFAEAFESDGYDSEALAVTERLPRATAPSAASPSPSSPGFELVADSVSVPPVTNGSLTYVGRV